MAALRLCYANSRLISLAEVFRIYSCGLWTSITGESRSPLVSDLLFSHTLKTDKCRYPVCRKQTDDQGVYSSQTRFHSGRGAFLPPNRDVSLVPLVSSANALHAPVVNQRAILETIHLPQGSLEQLRPRRTLARRDWQRFVAVRLTAVQAQPMEPILRAGSIAVIDRHYNSLVPVSTDRPNIYAVDIVNTLAFRYVTYEANRLILRPHAADSPVELLRLGLEDSPSALIVGRVCFVLSPL